jgi:hypothetical protein
METPIKNQLVERRSSETSQDWKAVGFVTEVEGNLCHFFGGGKTDVFIWRHPDGFNTLHRWFSPLAQEKTQWDCFLCGWIGDSPKLVTVDRADLSFGEVLACPECDNALV